MSIEKDIQLGLCCLNLTLREQKPSIYSSRTMIIRTIKEKGIDELKSRIKQNLKDCIKMIKWNHKNGIRVFRLSSELFPHKSNPKVEDYSFNFAKKYLKKIGKKARKYGQRLTFHPGQFNILGSPQKHVIEATIRDLGMHAEILDLIGCDKNSVMVIHGGGKYDDKMKTIDRWCENYKKLPDFIRNRLVIENCEKCFSIEDCILISNKVNIPIVFDTHHFNCYCRLHPLEEFKEPSEYIEDILNSWKRREIKPKFHISEQGSGRVGHHSDYVEIIPDYLLEIPEKYGIKIDIMIEAKKKELAIFKLYKKYPQLDCKKK